MIGLKAPRNLLLSEQDSKQGLSCDTSVKKEELKPFINKRPFINIAVNASCLDRTPLIQNSSTSMVDYNNSALIIRLIHEQDDDATLTCVPCRRSETTTMELYINRGEGDYRPCPDMRIKLSNYLDPNKILSYFKSEESDTVAVDESSDEHYIQFGTSFINMIKATEELYRHHQTIEVEPIDKSAERDTEILFQLLNESLDVARKESERNIGVNAADLVHTISNIIKYKNLSVAATKVSQTVLKSAKQDLTEIADTDAIKELKRRASEEGPLGISKQDIKQLAWAASGAIITLTSVLVGSAYNDIKQGKHAEGLGKGAAILSLAGFAIKILNMSKKIQNSPLITALNPGSAINQDLKDTYLKHEQSVKALVSKMASEAQQM